MVDTFITFGQKYSYEPHPTFPKAHPDGWLRVTADSYEVARQIVFQVLGPAFAFDYTEEYFLNSRHLYPRGELLHIDARLNRED